MIQKYNCCKIAACFKYKLVNFTTWQICLKSINEEYGFVKRKRSTHYNVQSKLSFQRVGGGSR